MAQNTEIAKAVIDLDGQQAGQELKDLENKAAELRKELNRLNKENDLAGYKKKEAELKQVNKQMGQYKSNITDVTRVLKNLNGTSLKDLERAKKALVSQTRLLTRNTAEYIEKSRQLKMVQSEISKVKSEMFGAQKAAGGLKGIFSSLKSLLPAIGFGTLLIIIKKIGQEIFNLVASNEQLALKSKTVLGPALEYVRKEAALHAAQMGLTNHEYERAVVNAADLLVPIKFEREEAAKLSTQLVNLSGALSEWTAGKYDSAEVSKILNKAMLGEAEQAKELGIVIDQSSQEFQKQIKYLMEVEGKTKEQAKALVILKQIQEKTTDAQSAFNTEGNRLLRMKKDIILFFKNLKESVAEWFEIPAADKLRKEQIELNTMTLKLTDANTKEEERLKIIKFLNDNYPDLFKNINLEKASYSELETIMDKVNKQFEHRIAMTLIEEDLKEQMDIINKKYDERKKKVDELNTHLAKMILFIRSNADKVDASIINMAENTQERINIVSSLLNDLRDQGEQIPEGYKQYLTLLDQNVALLDIELDKEKEREAFIKSELETYKEILGLKTEEGKIEKGQIETDEQKQERKKQMLEAIEIAYRKEANVLKQSYLDKLVSEEEYNQKSDELQVANIAARKAIMEKFGDDITEIEQQILDKKIAIWEEELKKIKEYAEKRAKAQTDGAKKTRDVYNKQTDGEIKADERGEKAQEEKERAQKAAMETKMEFYAQEAAAAVGNAKTIEDAAKNVINSIKDEIKAYLAKAIAGAIAKEIGTKGLLGIITAAIAAGAVSILFNKLIPEFSTGGLTGEGDKYEPKGIVHANEYVIASEELQQPDVKQYVKSVIEPRRLKRINFGEINHAIQLNRGFASGGFADQGADQNQTVQSQSINESKLDRMIVILDSIYQKIGNVKAVFGDTTVEKITERQNLISDIKRRVSRNKN